MKYNSFVITLLVIFVLFVSKSKAESIRDAFKRLANKKSNGGSMPGDVKGTVCKHTGHKVSNHKPTLCWNKHGPRCDSGFLKETECFLIPRRKTTQNYPETISKNLFQVRNV